MALAYLKVLHTFLQQTANITKEDKEQLLLGMLTYARTGNEPNLTGGAFAVWPFFKKTIDAQVATYNVLAANGKKGGEKPKKK